MSDLAKCAGASIGNTDEVCQPVSELDSLIGRSRELLDRLVSINASTSDIGDSLLGQAPCGVCSGGDEKSPLPNGKIDEFRFLIKEQESIVDLIADNVDRLRRI